MALTASRSKLIRRKNYAERGREREGKNSIVDDGFRLQSPLAQRLAYVWAFAVHQPSVGDVSLERHANGRARAGGGL